MKTIKATKTARYAQHMPYLPQVSLVAGEEYDLDDRLADRVVELDGGTFDLTETKVAPPEKKADEGKDNNPAPSQISWKAAAKDED